MTPLRPVPAALGHLSRTAGGAPLLTHYGPGGERTELSVTSFANWVDKTTNLLDDLGAAADDEVVLPVLADRPAHWMGLIWPFALWRAGLCASVAPAGAAGDAYLVVVGPHEPRPLAPLTLACSLDPWGRGLTGLPDGVLDYSSEALAQPDAAAARPADPGKPAWVDAERSLTGAELSSLDPVADRVLAQPATAFGAVSLLVRVVLGGGSVVLVEGPDADLARIAASERARAVVG